MNKIKIHRTCSECVNSKSWEQNKLLCKRDGIEVIPEDCCDDFVPKKQNKTFNKFIQESIDKDIDKESAKLQAENLFNLQNKTCEDCKFWFVTCFDTKVPDNICENFQPKEHINSIIFLKRSGIRAIDFSLQDESPLWALLQAAAKRCATTGNRKDLQNYLRLRREML